MDKKITIGQGIFRALYTTREKKQLKKMVFAFRSFSFRQSYCEIFSYQKYQNTFEQSRGHCENTQLVFLKKNGFCEIRGHLENF